MTTETDDAHAMELAADAVRMRRSADFRRRQTSKQWSEDRAAQTDESSLDQPYSPVRKFAPLMNLTNICSVALAMVTGTLSQLKLLVTSSGSHSYFLLFVVLLILSLLFHLCVAGTLILLTKHEVTHTGYEWDIEKLNLFRILTILIACVTLINIFIFMLA